MIHSIYGGLRSLCAALLLGSAAVAASAVVNSGNASLSALEIKVDGQNIVSGFSAGTVNYTVEAENSFPTLATFSAAPVASDATVDINVNGSVISNHSVAQLVKGSNNVSFTVKSGNATQTYTVNVAPVSNERTIYFKGGWSKAPYVYLYSDNPVVEHAGSWPGTQMSVFNSDWYYFELPEAADKDAMVIFNTGSDGSDRYPADQQAGIKLNFEGKEGWYLLSEYKWYSSNPDGPQKPGISVSPASGRVKGTTNITISFSNDPTSVSGSFNGLELSNLSTTSATVINVADYINDGESATLSLTASNDVGETTFSATYNRDDTQPVITLTGDSRELSIYQIMVACFQHGEGGAAGYSDIWGPDNTRSNGNLRGVIDALDYIEELGMNAIWLTPIFDSAGETTMGHGDKIQATGYYATDYFTVDPKFGTLDEFKELVAKAHEKGIYIILDGVFGHSGAAGRTLTSPSGNNCYVKESMNVANVRGTEAGNIAFPESLEYFKDVVRYWMGLGVDGWRLDQCYQVYQGGHNYWCDLRKEVESICSERKNRGEQWGTLGFMVGEDWTSAGNITVTRQDGLKSVMDFDGKDNLVSLKYGVGSIGLFLATDAAGRGYLDTGVNPTIFLSNHDTDRVGDVADVNTAPEKLMTRHAAVACYSGPTCTYYGDEIGDKCGSGGGSDNHARTPGRITGFNTNEQRLHDYVAKVFNARAENPALWRGTVERNSVSDNVEVITKTDAESGNKVVVIFSSVDTNVSIGGTGEDLINGGTVSGSVNVSAWVPAFIKMQ